MRAHIIKAPQVCQQTCAGFQSIVEGMVAKLICDGYAETTVSFYRQAAVHFAFWLSRRRIGPSQIKESHISGFLSQHISVCDCPLGGVRQHQTVRAAINHFVAVLKDAGYLPEAEAKEPDSIDRKVQDFDDYLLNTVGLQGATRTYRKRYVREFLQKLFSGREVDHSRLTPKDIVSYLSKRGAGLKPASTKVVASSLRSYFRFLQLHGRCEGVLVLAVPAFASWRLASLPAALTDEEVERLLSVFDLGTAAGRRDYAVTRCLVDLGLRAQEVAQLRLDHINWRKGTLRIVGTKSRRDDELPLTGAIGAAIAAYIRRGRPQTASREVFLQLHPPIGHCMTSRTVCDLVVRAAARADMGSKVTGTRILRHTAATRMLRHGASIKEIADVLRHRCLDTTAIYTKVDLPRLAAVALAWPKRGSL